MNSMLQTTRGKNELLDVSFLRFIVVSFFQLYAYMPDNSNIMNITDKSTLTYRTISGYQSVCSVHCYLYAPHAEAYKLLAPTDIHPDRLYKGQHMVMETYKETGHYINLGFTANAHKNPHIHKAFRTYICMKSTILIIVHLNVPPSFKKDAFDD